MIFQEVCYYKDLLVLEKESLLVLSGSYIIPSQKNDDSNAISLSALRRPLFFYSCS